MRAPVAVLPVLAFAYGVAAQHLDLQIPAVESAVHRMTSQFSKYVQYSGPTGHAAAQLAKPTKVNNAAQATSAACSYWYANIAHQGVAAFNSNSSYKVYRNVMDYGAKGGWYIKLLHL